VGAVTAGVGTGVVFTVVAGGVVIGDVHPAITAQRINEPTMRRIPRDFLIDPDCLNFPNDFMSITNVILVSPR
jgi:hypothetical protein